MKNIKMNTEQQMNQLSEEIQTIHLKLEDAFFDFWTTFNDKSKVEMKITTKEYRKEVDILDEQLLKTVHEMKSLQNMVDSICNS